jgi:nitrogen-specific signal transduction histidine kinase/CheY-like chemotaxis protein
VLDSLTAHIAVLDASGVIVKVNETWRRYAEENGAPVERKNYVNVCRNSSKTDDESANAAFIGINAVLQGEKNFFSMDTPVNLHWFLMTVTRLRDSQGVVVSHTNITECKLMEEEKLALQQQLQQSQKLESLGVLAGGIAHNFNNILAIIVGNCFLAKTHPDAAEDKISAIEKASERAAELCRQMLAYAGKGPCIKTLVNVGTLVDEMVTMLKATINQNAAITLDRPTTLPAVSGDASQLSQIVMNLIINAAEAIGEEQGEVRVSLSTTLLKIGHPEKDHLGKTIKPGYYLCLQLSDTGCGMDDETLHKIFEPFFSTKFAGRGLGMSAMLGIITTHQGAVQLTSQTGHGTTFKVYLPAQEDEAEKAALIQPIAPDPWQGSGTILLAEDEEQLLLLVTFMLRQLGFTVITATNGKEALALYQQHAAEITLVMTDIGMPVMDGYELFHELKKEQPKLPIIIFSGFGDTVITARIPREDIAGFVSKPYKFSQLQAVVRGAVEKG